MRLLARAAAASTLAATALLVPSTSAHAAALTCGGSAAPVFGTATPDASLNTQFTSYGNGNALLDDWTGADSTYSVKLPDGRTVFGFSDTFLGKVNADGTRSPVVEEGGTTPFINNSFVVKSGDRLTTAHGGTREQPKAVMPPRDDKHWYWAGDAITAGGKVQVTYQEYERFGPGIWDWRWLRNVVAKFRPDRLSAPVSVTPIASSQKISWASWLERRDGMIYVYGVEDLGDTKYMHLARVRGTDLTRPWEFYAGDGAWSRNEADSARVMNGVANEYSVTRMGNAYMLITQDTTELFSTSIVAYFSCSPQGPFTGKTTVYSTPETGANGSYGNANVFTYNAHAHPELSRPGSLVVSYNVNSFVNTDHYKDVTIYRPRFVDLKFG